MNIMERLDRHSIPEPNSGCLLWIGAINRDGYGTICVDRRAKEAYRVHFELVNGAVPDGLELDHKCRVRLCINPVHLEPVTKKVNCLRGQSFAAVNAVKTHCVHGHPFSGRNLVIRPNGNRDCRACGLEAARRYRERKAA